MDLAHLALVLALLPTYLSTSRPDRYQGHAPQVVLFTPFDTGLTDPVGPNNPTAQWGDYDADGDFDCAIAGAYTDYTQVHLYNTVNFSNMTHTFADIQGAQYGWVDWGDYDNDGDIDISALGFDTANGARLATIADNNGSSQIFV